MCRVSTVYANRIFVWMGRFSKIRFFIRSWKMEKKNSDNEEKSSSTVGLFVFLDNIFSSRSWSPENWRLVHNQSRSVQTYRSFNQLIESFKRFYTRWYSNNQFLTVLSLLYGSIQIEITEKASLRFWLRVQSLIFLLHTVECEHARTTSGEAARNEGWPIYFSPCIGVLVLVFLLSSVLFHNHQILMASLAFFSLNTVSYYRQHWRWVKTGQVLKSDRVSNLVGGAV